MRTRIGVSASSRCTASAHATAARADAKAQKNASPCVSTSTPLVRGERGADHLAVPAERRAVPLCSELLEEPRRPLHVGEEEGDRAGRQVARHQSLEVTTWWNAPVSRFLERLQDGPPIVGDGGMGVLVSSAVARLRCPEEANVRSPESVLSLHLGFIRAGADLIETNTFGANRHKLRTHYLEDELAAINGAGVKVARDAREVSGRDVFIAGSIGPLGDVRGSEDERTRPSPSRPRFSRGAASTCSSSRRSTSSPSS